MSDSLQNMRANIRTYFLKEMDVFKDLKLKSYYLTLRFFVVANFGEMVLKAIA